MTQEQIIQVRGEIQIRLNEDNYNASVALFVRDGDLYQSLQQNPIQYTFPGGTFFIQSFHAPKIEITAYIGRPFIG